METKVEEIWRHIPLAEIRGDYSVSNKGRIRNNKTGRVLKPFYDKRNYVRITFPDQINHYVHRLVLISFEVPNPENKRDVNHINGITSDNRIENLEWATRLENIRHALIIGLHAAGRGNVVLDASKVLAIRAKYTPRVRGSADKLAKEYGITKKTLYKIIFRERWKFI